MRKNQSISISMALLLTISVYSHFKYHDIQQIQNIKRKIKTDNFMSMNRESELIDFFIQTKGKQILFISSFKQKQQNVTETTTTKLKMMTKYIFI